MANDLRKRLAHAIGSSFNYPNDFDDVEAADAALEVIEAELQQLRARAEQAEALLRELADPDPCEHFDHHGQCQTHDLGNPCAHGLAQQLFAKLEGR